MAVWVQRGCDAGRYRDGAVIRAQIRRITGYGGSDQHLDAAWCSAFRPDPEVTELLGRHRGGRRGVFTNNGPLEEEVLTRLYPDAFGPFEHLFFCWRLTANKPDPAVPADAVRALRQGGVALLRN